jgi:hypothetical protein
LKSNVKYLAATDPWRCVASYRKVGASNSLGFGWDEEERCIRSVRCGALTF